MSEPKSPVTSSNGSGPVSRAAEKVVESNTDPANYASKPETIETEPREINKINRAPLKTYDTNAPGTHDGALPSPPPLNKKAARNRHR